VLVPDASHTQMTLIELIPTKVSHLNARNILYDIHRFLEELAVSEPYIEKHCAGYLASLMVLSLSI
jgi:hypothetical protein